MAASVSVRRVGVCQSGIIASQAAPQITDSAPQVGACLAGQPDLKTVIAAAGFRRCRTLGAKRNRIVIVDVVGIRNYGRPAKDVCKWDGARIPDVVTEIIRDRHIFDGLIESLARVSSID